MNRFSEEFSELMASEPFPRRSPVQLVSGVAILLLLMPNFQILGVAANEIQLAATTNSMSSSFTWEANVNGTSLDPHVATCSILTIDCNIVQNVYETLLWYNGATSDRVIPWLAKEYTISPDGRSIQFTLRDGIRFADGNPLNSTAVYFSLNRLVLEGSNGGFLCCDFQHNYTASWVDKLLAQNLVMVTGPLTFQIKILHPDGGLIYTLAVPYAAIVDPQFVMSHDLALWTEPNSTTLLPYPVPSGSLMERITQYFKNEAVACKKTDSTSGCLASYLVSSGDGSLAGTGPYVIRSNSADLTHVVLSARSDYWGGPNQFTGAEKIAPHFNNVYVNEVPLESDRLQDLRNAAARGEAMSVVVNTDALYALANRSAWLMGGTLSSIIQNVSLYGPYPIGGAGADSIPFVMNVSDASTGRFYQFQPFADLRLRLAFADAVDIGRINRDYNANMGKVAPNYIPLGSAPPGAYNSSILPSYSFSPKKVQDLLVNAMEHPLTSFRFFNGTVAPPGLFNNTFGCPALNARHQCDNPVSRAITLAYSAVGGAFSLHTTNTEVIRTIATAINNVSDTYHMGLHVAVEVIPFYQLAHQGFEGSLYMFEYFSGSDTPWVGNNFSPGAPLTPTSGFCNTDLPSCLYPSDDGWNSTRKNQLFDDFLSASSESNVSGVVFLSNQLMELENRAVTHVWTIYPYTLEAVTSNVQGFYHNGYIHGMYYASLHYSQPSSQGSFLDQLISDWPILFFLVLAGGSVLTVGLFVFRSSRGSKTSDGGATELSQIGVSRVPIPDQPIARGFNVQLVLNVPDEVEVGRVFHLKLDLINTGGGVAALHKVEGLVPEGLSLERPNQGTRDSPNGDFQVDGSVLLRGVRLRPSEIRSIQYDAQAAKEGEVIFGVKASYSDERGELFTASSPTARLAVHYPSEFEFKTERSKMIFEFLLSAFIHDYMEKKYLMDKAGWRSLVEVSQTTKIPIPTLYGRGGGIGPNLQELTSRGLVETRTFPGERGRGGNIMRVRIAYERDPVKEIVGRRVRINK